MFTIAKIATFIAAIGAVSAHGLITEVTGANGVTGEGFGVVASTPRDGSGSKPFQVSTSTSCTAEISLTNLFFISLARHLGNQRQGDREWPNRRLRKDGHWWK